MGGHQDGGYASQLVAQLVAGAELPSDVVGMANSVSQALQTANAQMRRRAAGESSFDGGTTVVAVCISADRGIVEWAGDSRLYRWRAGELTQLTRDHTVGNEDGSAVAEEEAHMITRAVGCADVLELDRVCFEVRDRDRYLLCTDGLYGDLTPAEISRLLGTGDCPTAARGLIALALERGGGDNMTAVVVEVSASNSPT